jgi:tetratricopeptide (TPR) repeat protein
MTRGSCLGLVVALAVWTIFPASSYAQSTETATTSAAAEEFTEAGRLYYENGQYLEALQAFERAYDIAPSAPLAYNIARTHEELSQWPEAIEFYETYLEMETDPRERAEVLDKLEILKKRVGTDPNDPQVLFEARMEAGRTAYRRGDYETAISEFAAAFEIEQDSAALYNIGKSYERLARYEEAIDYLSQYLELEPDAPDRADVEETIIRLRKAIRERFQELAVSSEPPGADIYIDDREEGLVGQTNFRFKLTPGEHTLYLDLNGYEPVERTFTMPDDKPLALDFDLKPLENVGEVQINVEQEGARIFIDGAIVGLSPFTQKKKLEQGSHQIQVELPGYQRYSESFEVVKDQLTVLDIELEAYKAGISDKALSGWGNTLLITGILGGTLGVLAPFIYQEFVLERPYFEQLGPVDTGGGNFYRGPLPEGDPNRVSNSEYDTLRDIQIASVIAGSVLAAGGLTFYFVKWFRKKPQAPPGATARRGGLRIDNFGLAPTPGQGAAFGLSGRF